MPIFELQGPDGKQYEVEAPSAEAAVGAFKQFAPAPSRPEMSEAEKRARARVTETRSKQGGFTKSVDDTMRNFARGTPVGSWADEMDALASGAVHKLTGGRFGETYEDRHAYQNAYNKVVDEESTKLGELPVIGDVTAGGLTKLAGGVLTAPLAPVARVTQGGSMLPTAVNLGVTGAGYGALYGAGEGQGADRATNAMIGGAVGAPLGVGTAFAARGVGNAMGAMRNWREPLPQGVQGFERQAVRRLSDAAAMDGLNPGAAFAARSRLGDEGMVGDIGENLTMVTEGLAQQPGPQRQIIADALERRADGAPQRVRWAVDQAMGPTANIPRTVEGLRAQYGAQAAPLYDQFYRTPVPVTPQLQAVLQRVPERVMNKAQELAAIDRNYQQYVQQAGDPNGAVYDLVKRAADDLAQAAGRGTNEHRLFSQLSHDLRTAVDEALSPGNPAASPWAQGRAIAGEGIGIREAIDEGQQAFRRGMTADQLEANMSGLTNMERAGFQTGAREGVRSVMDNAATNFGPRGDAAGRRLLNSPENQRKMQMIVGAQPANALQRTIRGENAMAETYNQVMSNSATARRQATRDIIPRQHDQTSAAALRPTSATGLLAEGLGRVWNVLTAGALNERNQRIATDMARMLVSQGAAADDVALGLLQFAQQRGVSRQHADAAEQVVRALLSGARQPAVSGAVGQ